MYNIADVLPAGTVSELESGTSLLVAGPAMSGKQDLALDLLAAGLGGSNGLLIVTTNESAATCIDALEERATSFDRDLVGVVDCSGSSQQEAIQEIATQRVSSPGDLTGISIGTAKLMQQFTSHDISGVRHGLVSVSTLLQYLDLETVFKFLHIYTTRITDTQGLGIFTLDSVSHDPQTINTVTNQFDGMIELRETDTGEREARVRGVPNSSSGWQTFKRATCSR
jgi:KaiC/GvpD/RAD55 family RecA-like ATPase